MFNVLLIWGRKGTTNQNLMNGPAIDRLKRRQNASNATLIQRISTIDGYSSLKHIKMYCGFTV